MTGACRGGFRSRVGVWKVLREGDMKLGKKQRARFMLFGVQMCPVCCILARVSGAGHGTRAAVECSAGIANLVPFCRLVAAVQCSAATVNLVPPCCLVAKAVDFPDNP